MRILLQFDEAQTAVHRSRLSYAFRVFCAVYGHQPVLGVHRTGDADVCITYRRPVNGSGASKLVYLNKRYRHRTLDTPAPAPVPFTRHGMKTHLFYGAAQSCEPDWLAEIFEWISCADEYSCQRDGLGCISFDRSYIGRNNLDPQMPYAAIAMWFLQHALQQAVPGSDLKPVSPLPECGHFIIPSHDVDYLPLHRLGSVQRLLKNVLVSCLVHRSLSLAAQQATKALKLALGGEDDPLDQTDGLSQMETSRAVTSTFFFLTERGHRRDGNYKISHKAATDLMNRLQSRGMEIAVHASYASLDQPHKLANQFHRLRQLKFQPLGNRQHWLRFTLDRLIPAMEEAGALYDSSLGWPKTMGFRSGACFAFPPYYFPEERPAKFLEIPLTVMDFCLLPTGNSEPQVVYSRLAKVLENSRRWGWGGISILWHPTAFGGGQLPQSIAQAFWQMIDRKTEFHDTWISAEEFLKAVGRRYFDVGLLPPDFKLQAPEVPCSSETPAQSVLSASH